MSKKLKILISAYACSPYKGSEPGVGWGFVSNLAKHHDLWVIVEEEKFKEDIERYVDEHPEFPKTTHFYFIHKKRSRSLRKIWPPSYYWYYKRWHKDALVLAKHLHQEINFDIAHQLTMVGFREPGFLWKLNIPFVWGPVGGMGLFPWEFLPTVGLRGALYYMGYNIFNMFHMNCLRRPKLAAQIANNGLITATIDNQRSALQYWDCNSVVIPEVGVPENNQKEMTPRKDNEPLRIVWTGLHIPRKALNLGLEALARLPKCISWRLDILGDGPLSVKWQRLTEELNIKNQCSFHGWIPRDKVFKIMSQSHLMLITSLRDLTSTVTIEALVAGIPIVCLDHCGFAPCSR